MQLRRGEKSYRAYSKLYSKKGKILKINSSHFWLIKTPLNYNSKN